MYCSSMKISQPLVFRPLFFERVWGGRKLAELYGKQLPATVPIGESWEIVDRQDAQSIIESGELGGSSLHELWHEQRQDVFGHAYADHSSSRFPLLIKLLDARQKLSVQVHPPASVANELGGVPKTEVWHVLHADHDADIFAGLRRGVTRQEFERGIQLGQTADLIHRIPTSSGDTIFIPSGRIHAIGSGNVILEVQQNSDTTYRVFDWNRTGLDGMPRELHIEQSLRSINFEDYEPVLQSVEGNTLVADPLFQVDRITLGNGSVDRAGESFAIYFCIDGEVVCGSRSFHAGDFWLLPAASELTVTASGPLATVTKITLPA